MFINALRQALSLQPELAKDLHLHRLGFPLVHSVVVPLLVEPQQTVQVLMAGLLVIEFDFQVWLVLARLLLGLVLQLLMVQVQVPLRVLALFQLRVIQHWVLPPPGRYPPHPRLLRCFLVLPFFRHSDLPALVDVDRYSAGQRAGQGLYVLCRMMLRPVRTQPMLQLHSLEFLGSSVVASAVLGHPAAGSRLHRHVGHVDVCLTALRVSRAFRPL